MARFDFLRARVATRVVMLFVVGALVPVLVMASLSFTAVSSQLENQSQARLRQFAVGASQMILERLASYRAWVQSAGTLAVHAAPSGTADGAPLAGRISTLAPGVEGIALAAGGRVLPIAGETGPVPELGPQDLAHLESGGAVLRAKGATAGVPAALHLGVPAGDGGWPEGVLWARLAPDSVWASAALMASDPAVEDFCVLDSDSRPFYCKKGLGSRLASQVPPAGARANVSGVFNVEAAGEAHFVAWRSVYLKSVYAAPEWTVAVDEAASSVYAPVDSFAYNLPVALAIGLGLVLLLANIVVRRTMEPLEKLAAGTMRIARHDLSTRVVVAGRDEFAELASSFNTMAERLSLQFRQIEAGRVIDRAVISANDRGEAADALLQGIGQLVSDAQRVLLLLDVDRDGAAVVYSAQGYGEPTPSGPTKRRGMARPWIDIEGRHFLVEAHERAPGDFDACGLGGGRLPVLVIPLVVQGEPVGAFAVEAEHVQGFTDEGIERARQLADQAAVGFHELKLRRELVEMSWEALRALAAAIDAKSTWTAGHSERVTQLALALGRELQLDAKDMDVLHRGGLLHDIGKIGVPVDIIDFAGPMDGPMREAMEAHPVIGARILEPIRVFQPILPIVLYHHERWNGSGYPEGLSGTAIPRLARVLAVADVFDAMASARPYRSGVVASSVLEYIRAESGRGFDPEVVDALTSVMADGWTFRDPEPEAVADD